MTAKLVRISGCSCCGQHLTCSAYSISLSTAESARQNRNKSLGFGCKVISIHVPASKVTLSVKVNLNGNSVRTSHASHRTDGAPYVPQNTSGEEEVREGHKQERPNDNFP